MIQRLRKTHTDTPSSTTPPTQKPSQLKAMADKINNLRPSPAKPHNITTTQSPTLDPLIRKVSSVSTGVPRFKNVDISN